MKKEKLIKKFNSQAEKFAKERKKQYGYIWRRKIFSSAQGKTLELAVGAGMNFAYFPKSIDYTGVDFSPAMLENAKEAAREHQIRANFVLSDVESLDFEEDTFDTIVSSASLCAYEDPVFVLKQANKWCKKDGRILLMEHGLLHSPILAWLQKNLDPLSVRFIGCHMDRDILEIVKQSDLVIDRQERAMGGYLYLIWARPNKH